MDYTKGQPEFSNSGEDSQGRIVLRIPLKDINKYLAAQDMYEALKEITHGYANGNFKTAVLYQAKLAIAKAEGI